MKMLNTGSSLVAQWLRICLTMQGHGFEPWSGKIPRAAEQLSLCTTTTEPALEHVSHNYWAHMPQLLKPACLEPMLCDEKPLQREAHALQWRVAPAHRNWRKLRAATKTQRSQKKKKLNTYLSYMPQLLHIISLNENLCSQKNLHVKVDSNITHKSQKLETILKSLNGYMDK